jgi:hypothetical protein
MKMDKIPTIRVGKKGCGALVARGLALKFGVGKSILTVIANHQTHGPGL